MTLSKSLIPRFDVRLDSRHRTKKNALKKKNALCTVSALMDLRIIRKVEDRPVLWVAAPQFSGLLLDHLFA